MIIRSAQFQCSSEKVSQCPKSELPEFAFIGRSNVGKSSLINMLTGNKDLAKVSGTPGKTRLINHFIINDQWYLVDLPGYGYAKVSKNKRELFSKMIENYILKHENLCFVFVLVDSRHEPQKSDIEFIRFLGDNEIPLGIIFTKADKLSSSKLESNICLYKREMKKEWSELPLMFTSSSEKKTGRDEILGFVESVLKKINEQPQTETTKETE